MVPFRGLSQTGNTRGDQFDDQLIFNFVSFTTHQKICCLRIGTPHRWKTISSHAHKTGPWYLVGVLFNISDEQPRPFSGFLPFFGNKFPGLFQDFSRTQIKIHINPFTTKISMLILLTLFHTFHIFLLDFNRFPALSRTSSLFLGLSSPGKGQNKIWTGLSRFSRTRTNSAFYMGCPSSRVR